MTDMGGGIWSITLPLDEIAWQFKFTIGNCVDLEMFTEVIHKLFQVVVVSLLIGTSKLVMIK